MKFKTALVLFLIALPAFAASVPKPDYIGFKHKGVVYGETLSNGVRDLGGGLLSNENYGVSRFTKGKSYMLWLEKITARDPKGVPSWEVKDVLTFDLPQKNQKFRLSYSSNCTLGGKSDIDLIVMGETDPKSKTYKVKKAWKASVRKEKFEKISTKNVKCEYVEPEKINKK